MIKNRIFSAAAAAVILIGMGFSVWASGHSQPWVSNPGFSSNPNMSYAFSAHNNVPGRYDRNGDGRVDLIIVDRNGDGVADYWATDRNFNGVFDDYQYDRNFNGKVDQWEYDLDGNGVSDLIYVDTTGDGSPDLTGKLNPLTKTYTWYGDMKTVSTQSGGSTVNRSTSMPRRSGARMDLPTGRPTRPLARGRPAWSD